ncbi:MAG TPA: hypothetical protein PK537_00755 [Candidatus Limiplasma sp.]|nr:hypothetical protein [Candidatus Limiplasma sp.]
MLDISRPARMGLLLISPERFAAIGEGTARGSYLERKQKEAAWMADEAGAIAEVTFPGIVFTAEDTRRAMDAFTAAGVDYVLAIYLSWAEDFAWIRFLRDMPPCPVLFCHRMRDEICLQDTHDDDEFTEYLCCGGLVGSLEASGSIRRIGRPMMETFAGTWTQVLARARVFGSAARARTLLRQSSFGLLACMNEVMWSTYVDPYAVFSQVGPEMRFLSVAELEDSIEAVTPQDALTVMRRIAARYEVLPNVSEEKFLASVRASMGMERLAEERGIDLLVLNDIDRVLFERVGLRPGFWPTSPTVKTHIVPEGDIGGGIACYVLKLLTGGHVNYIEPFHIDLPNQCFAGGHAGPNDYTDPRGKCKISSDVRFAKTKWKYAGAPFAWYVFPSGEKTMLHCSSQTGRFQLVASRVEALPTEHFLATYSHSLFRPIGQSSTQLFARLLQQGVTQHYGIADGNVIPAVKDLAMMLDLEFAQV